MMCDYLVRAGPVITSPLIESAVNPEDVKEDHATHGHNHDHDHDYHHHHHHHEHDHGHEHIDHHSYDHTHDPGVSSVSIVCEGSLDLEKRFVFQVGLMPYILDLLVSGIIGSGWFKMIFYLSYG
ncbi:hypothetical protein AAG906_021405 [Vitis piasezkii]